MWAFVIRLILNALAPGHPVVPVSPGCGRRYRVPGFSAVAPQVLLVARCGGRPRLPRLCIPGRVSPALVGWALLSPPRPPPPVPPAPGAPRAGSGPRARRGPLPAPPAAGAGPAGPAAGPRAVPAADWRPVLRWRGGLPAYYAGGRRHRARRPAARARRGWSFVSSGWLAGLCAAAWSAYSGLLWARGARSRALGLFCVPPGALPAGAGGAGLPCCDLPCLPRFGRSAVRVAFPPRALSFWCGVSLFAGFAAGPGYFCAVCARSRTILYLIRLGASVPGVSAFGPVCANLQEKCTPVTCSHSSRNCSCKATSPASGK